MHVVCPAAVALDERALHGSYQLRRLLFDCHSEVPLDGELQLLELDRRCTLRIHASGMVGGGGGSVGSTFWSTTTGAARLPGVPPRHPR